MSSPTPETELVVSESVRMSDHAPDGTRPLKAASFFFGPMQSERGATLHLGSHCPSPSVSVVFFPGVVPMLMKQRAAELTGVILCARDLFRNSIEELRNRVSETNDPSTIVQALNEFLERTILKQVHLFDEVPALAAQRMARGMSVAQVAQNLGISERQLERRFNESWGMAPRVALGISRFRRAAELLANDSTRPLTDLALESGYSDQSHMNRAFRRFADTSPAGYRLKRAQALYLP
jgi:AraC-like DNA-binding protein